MTSKEELMYNIIKTISEAGSPVIFKGALITKLILEANDFNKISRQTFDIDATWVGEYKSTEEIAKQLNDALGRLSGDYLVVAGREADINQSASVSFVEVQTGDTVVKMDVEVKKDKGNTLYNYNGATIKGVLVDEILADKISSCSTDKVFKQRNKDMIDVYALSHCVEINIKDIAYNIEKYERRLENFSGFYNNIEDLKHAYNKNRRFSVKPPFEEVYSYMKEFFRPFMESDFSNKKWNYIKVCWEDVPVKETEFSQNSNKASAPKTMAEWKDLIAQKREEQGNTERKTPSQNKSRERD